MFISFSSSYLVFSGHWVATKRSLGLRRTPRRRLLVQHLMDQGSSVTQTSLHLKKVP